MTTRTSHPLHAHAPVARAPVARAPEAVRSVLVPLDLSPVSDRVAARLALLPVAPRARVTLLHVVPEGLVTRVQRRVVEEVREALAHTRIALGNALPDGAIVDTSVVVGVPALAIAERASAMRAELVVMGRGYRGLRDFLLGSTAERVIRRGQLPVLAVRGSARQAYRRPAVAMDLEQRPDHVVELLHRVTMNPRLRACVIHAYEVPYRGLAGPSLADEDADAYREQYRQQAMLDIRARVAAARARWLPPPAEGPAWPIHVRAGDPVNVVERVVTKERSDLLALATHGYHGMAHAFLGSVAGDILRQVACDVLVVPPRRATRGNR